VKKPERRHEKILRDLVDQIVAGTIPVGARVPYESEIADRYRVSRTVAREAVQRLTGFGLVEVRRRSGAAVTPHERWNLLEPTVLDAAMRAKPSTAFFSALFEARLILEPAAAAMAAQRIDAEELEQIAAALAVMKDAPSQTAFVEADMRFHATILDATGNWVLRRFAGVLASAFKTSIRHTYAAGKSMRRSLDMHNQVLAALRTGDVDRARAAMSWLLTQTRLEVEAMLREREA